MAIIGSGMMLIIPWDKKCIAKCDTSKSNTSWAAGAVVSTINDLIKWDSPLDNNILLKKSSFDEMVTPENYQVEL